MDYFWLMLRLQFFCISSASIYLLLNKYKQYQTHHRISSILPERLVNQIEQSPHRHDYHQLLGLLQQHFMPDEIQKLILHLLPEDKLIDIKQNIFSLTTKKIASPEIIRWVITHRNQGELKTAMTILEKNKIHTPSLYQMILQHRRPYQFAQAYIERTNEIISIEELFHHPHCPLELIRAFQYLEERDLLSLEHYEYCLSHSAPLELAMAVAQINQLKLTILQEHALVYTHPHPHALVQLVLELSQLELLNTNTLKFASKHRTPLEAAKLLDFLKKSKLFPLEDVDKILIEEIAAEDVKNLELIQAAGLLTPDIYQLILGHPHPKLLQQGLRQLQDCHLLHRALLELCFSKGSESRLNAIDRLFQARVLNPMTTEIIFKHTQPQSIAKILSLLDLDIIPQDILKTILGFFDPYHLAISLSLLHQYQGLTTENLGLILTLPISSLADILTRLERHRTLASTTIQPILSQQKLDKLCSCIELLESEGLLNTEHLKLLLRHDDLDAMLNILDILQENQRLTPTQLKKALHHRMPRGLAHSLAQFFHPRTGLASKTAEALNTIFRDYPCILAKDGLSPATLEQTVLQQIIDLCNTSTLERKQIQEAIRARLRPNAYIVYLAQLEQDDLEQLILEHTQLFVDGLRAPRHLQDCIWKLSCLAMLKAQGFQGLWPLLKTKILEDFFKTHQWLYLHHHDPRILEQLKVIQRIGLSEEFLNKTEVMLNTKLHSISGNTSAIFHQKYSQIYLKLPEEAAAMRSRSPV